MNKVYLVCMLLLISQYGACQNDPLMDGFQIAEEYGFRIRTYDVITSDGYILSLWRLLSEGQDELTSNTRNPIYLAHAIMDSAESYMYHGPELSPAFYLYNQGYDVWLGNARGCVYSRRHQVLNPDIDSEFWNFGIEELGIDHVADIDLILQETGHERLSLLAYSLGGSSTIASIAMNPSYYEQRTDILIALAPALSFINSPSLAYRLVIEMPAIFNLFRLFGIDELNGSNRVKSRLTILT